MSTDNNSQQINSQQHNSQQDVSEISAARALKLERDRIRASNRRANETPEKRAERLKSDRLRAQANRRDKETPEKRAERLEKNRLRAQANRRDKETPEKRAERLEKNKLRARAHRANESSEQKALRLNNDAFRAKIRRTMESTEATAQRLTINQQRVEANRTIESDSARALRLAQKALRSRTTRMNESESEQRERLNKIAEYQRERRLNACSIMSDSEVKELENNNGIQVPDDAVLQEIYNDTRQAMGESGLGEHSCIVCDRLCPTESIQTVLPETLPLENMKRRLRPQPDLPQPLINYYDVSCAIPQFTDMMLSMYGVIVSDSGDTIHVNICDTCNSALQRGDSTVTKPHRLCIANGFAIGELPTNLYNSTWSEHAMTKIVSVTATTTVLRGGYNRALTSHFMCFDGRPGPFATMLPRTNLNDTEKFQVIFAGPMTPEQKVLASVRYTVRHEHIRQLLEFYTNEDNNNPFYYNVEWDLGQLNMHGVIDGEVPEGIIVSMSSEVDAIHQMESDMASVARDDACLEETTEIRNDSLFVQTGDVTSKQAISSVRKQYGAYVARRSNIFYQEEGRGSSLGAMFPELFPYGRGHPAEHRLTSVSFQESCKYYLSLSSRRFAQHRLFLLVAFDKISLSRMFNASYLKYRKPSRRSNVISTISDKELEQYLKEQEERENLIDQGLGNFYQDTRSGPAILMKGVQSACSHVWGTNQERARTREQAFAFQTYFGLPQIFFTITPNMNGSYVLAYYSGAIDTKTLRFARMSDLPKASELFSIASKNPVAAAKLYVKIRDIVLNVLLGFDRKTKMPYKRGGIFGHVCAYAGSTETQGTGNLHFHCLVWLYGVPRTLSGLEEALADPENGDLLVQRIISFSERVVSHSLLLGSNDLSCLSCGQSGSSSNPTFKAIDIPDSAKKDPSIIQLRSPPFIAQCRFCDTKTSAQDLNAWMLKKKRPSRWPIRNIMSPTDNNITLNYYEQDFIYHCHDMNNEADKYDQEMYPYLEYLEEMRKLEEDDNPHRSSHSDLNIDMLYKDKFLEEIMKMPQGPNIQDLDRDTVKFIIDQIVLLVNHHRWQHAKSCFKSTKRYRGQHSTPASCRYNFPHHSIPESTFENACIQLKRNIGSEYINGFNEILTLAMRCNHDVQVLIGGHAVCDRMYYVFKYAFKNQQTTDSRAAVQLASFRRRQEKEARAVTDTSEQDVARRRVTGLAVTTTGKQEIASPLCALYIQESASATFSHERQSLHLGQYINILASEEYEVVLEEESRYNFDVENDMSQQDDVNENSDRRNTQSYQLNTHETLCNYTERGDHEELESLNIYFWTSEWETVGLKQSRSSRIIIPHRSSHPRPGRYGLAKRTYNVIPDIRGPRLADPDNLYTHEEREKFAMIALILFKPFRTVYDLKEMHSTWWDAYISFEPDERSKLILTHMKDYHICRHIASPSSGEPYMDQLEHNTADNIENHEDTEDYEYEDLLTVFDRRLENEFVFDEENPALFPSSGVRSQVANEVIDQLISSNAMNAISQEMNQSYEARFTQFSEDSQYMRLTTGLYDNNSLFEQYNMRKRQPNILTVNDSSFDLSINNIDDIEALLYELPKALEEDSCKWRPPSSEQAAIVQENIESKSTITAVSSVYSLNKEQHAIFVLAARSMLKTWQSASENLINGNIDNEVDSFFGFLGGEGGTGKSRVINALNAFAKSWMRSKQIKTVAMTGKAAVNVSGDTVHGLLGFRNLVSASSSHPGYTMAEDMRNELRLLTLLIIDECSMLKKSDLARIDSILRWARDSQEKIFGGCHILLCGDFFQLPPPGTSLPLYVSIDRHKKPSEEEIQGYELWTMIKDVVILTQNKRHERDPEWGTGCSQARRGNWTPEFIEMINDRLVPDISIAVNFSECFPQMLEDSQTVLSCLSGKSYVPFVTPTNEIRQTIINHFTYVHAASLPHDHLPIRVVARLRVPKTRISEGVGRTELSIADLKYVMSLPDSSLKRQPPFIDCIIGMPLAITQNISKGDGIVNGTIGTLYDIVYENGTRFTDMRDEMTNVLVRVADKPPKMLLLQVKNPKFYPFDGLPQDVYPLFVHTASGCKVTLPNPRREVTLTIVQFPCVNAIGSSVYKIQGDTLDPVVVANWRSKTKADTVQQGYVMVSRAVSRHSFLTMEVLDQATVDYFCPPDHALEEEARLEVISEQTIERLARYFN